MNIMERDSSLHGDVDQPFSLYKSHIIMKKPFLSTPNYNTFSLSSNSQSKGLLRAPPLSLLHSAPPPQPPLLPLPASLPRRSFSCPPPAVKIGARKPRNHFSSKKKSTKSSTSTNNNIPTKEEKIKSPELPKNIARVPHFDNSVKDEGVDDIFTISPPPASSLPLPTFSLRPKLACNAAAAAGVDAGATDDLRRILRLQ